MSTPVSSINLGTIGSAAGIPDLNVATVPANVRNGGSKAMQAYSEGLAFEDVLVGELTQQLATSMFGGSSSDGSGAGAPSGSDPSAGSGSMLGGAGASAYASLLPQALTSSIMADGGLGVAKSFAEQLDPALSSPPGSAAK
jgi:hypothetical protein